MDIEKTLDDVEMTIFSEFEIDLNTFVFENYRNTLSRLVDLEEKGLTKNLVQIWILKNNKRSKPRSGGISKNYE